MQTVSFWIGLGEIFAGFFYVAIGVAFVVQAMITKRHLRAKFRFWVALVFLIAGAEELADAFFHEGGGAFAIWVQATLTAAQFITGGVCVYALRKAGIYRQDFRRK